MGRAGQRCILGAVAAVATVAAVACASFDADEGSRPASEPDGATADDAGAADGAGMMDGAPAPDASACAPFECPTGAILCESFETTPIGESTGWLVQDPGMVVPVEECTGTAMAGTVPAASSSEPRRARVVRVLSTNSDRREFFLDLDAWVQTKGAFTKFGFGTILALSAVNGSQASGLVGLSFGVDGLGAVVRGVGDDVTKPAPIPFATWVHVGLHVKFDEAQGIVEVAFDGTTVASFAAKTLAGPVDGFSLQVGALTDEDATPELTVKIDNIVLR